MLKNLLIKCADILGRDDISSKLKSFDDISMIDDTSIQNDVTRLVSFYNFTVNTICENYLELITIDTIKSNSERKIYYNDFFHYPVRILKVSDDGSRITEFQVFTHYLLTKYPNTYYQITYKYVPIQVTNLNEEIILPLKLSEKIVCYGIVSEFLASKSQYNQSEYWRNKFLYEIYKIKTRRERRLKSTFVR